MKSFPEKFDTSNLFSDIHRMIEDARSAVASAVNAGLTMLYWHIGRRIREDVLNEKRAQYGKEIVVTLSQQLEPRIAPAGAEGSTDRRKARKGNSIDDG